MWERRKEERVWCGGGWCGVVVCCVVCCVVFVCCATNVHQGCVHSPCFVRLFTPAIMEKNWQTSLALLVTKYLARCLQMPDMMVGVEHADVVDGGRHPDKPTSILGPFASHVRVLTLHDSTQVVRSALPPTRVQVDRNAVKRSIANWPKRLLMCRGRQLRTRQCEARCGLEVLTTDAHATPMGASHYVRSNTSLCLSVCTHTTPHTTHTRDMHTFPPLF